MSIKINDLETLNYSDFGANNLQDMSDVEIAQIFGGVSFSFTFSSFDLDGSGFIKEITINDDGATVFKTTTLNSDGSGMVSILE